MDNTTHELIKRIESLESKVDRILQHFEFEGGGSVHSDEPDPLFPQAIQLIEGRDRASASLFQRRLKVGYARAARLLDELCEKGYIGEAEGAKPRKVTSKPVSYIS